MLRDIAQMLCNPILQELFPDTLLPPGKYFKNWETKNERELTVRRDSEFGYIPQEPQIVAFGNLSKTTGTRFDYGFPDDIIDKDTVRSANMMEKAEEFWAFIRSCYSGDGYTTMTGTFYHYSDLYNKIIEEGHFPKNRIYIRPVEMNGKIQYPTRWTRAELAREEKIQGRYIFACQYHLNPVPRGEEVFPPPQPTFETLPEGEYQNYITVDPAPTTHD